MCMQTAADATRAVQHRVRMSPEEAEVSGDARGSRWRRARGHSPRGAVVEALRFGARMAEQRHSRASSRRFHPPSRSPLAAPTGSLARPLARQGRETRNLRCRGHLDLQKVNSDCILYPRMLS